MLVFEFPGPIRAALIARKARRIAKKSNRQAVNFLLRKVPVRTSPVHNESYYGEELNYMLGLLAARPKDAAAAVRAMSDSHILPFGGGNRPFENVQSEATSIAAAQDRAVARGVPAFLISCMPRSASAALTQTLASVVDAPIMRISVGSFPKDLLVPTWFDRAMRGGCVLHDHFGALPFNISTLRSRGVDKVSVLIRDPRAAAASFANHVSDRPSSREILRTFSKSYMPWLNGWLDAEQNQKIAVNWVLQKQVTGGDESLRGIIEKLTGLSYDVRLHSANFVHGNPERWREQVSARHRNKMWHMLPTDARQLLDLEP